MSREHRNEDSWLFSMKMQTRTQSPPSKTIGNDYHGMREKEKGKESSVVCLCERERAREGEGEGREVEEAGNTAHKHTGRPRDKPKGKKKYQIQAIVNTQANKSELMLPHFSICKYTKTAV